MNLALQKRNEQLERWRQNEADVELMHQHQDPADKIDETSSSSYQNIHQQQANHLPRSNETYSDSPRRNLETNNNSNNNNKNDFKSINNKTSAEDEADLDRQLSPHISPSTPLSKRPIKSSKRDRAKSGLQVKFSDETLFLNACANGDIDECERMLKDRLVDINVTTSDGLTGLHEAAICGNPAMVEYLINHGANVDCCDNEGWTPLHAAASLGQVQIVQILLDHNADVTIVNCENLLAYDLARNDQVQAIIGERLQGIDIDQLRSQEERAIQEDIERWIKTGQYDERSHPVTNATVLHVLAAKGYVKLMKRILESPVLKNQINLEARDNEGYTPLLAASFWVQNEIVELLIENGANIFAQADNGYKICSIVSILKTVRRAIDKLASKRNESLRAKQVTATESESSSQL